MFEAIDSEYLVPFDGTFKVAEASSVPLTNGTPHKGKHRRKRTEDLNKLQRVLAAGDKHAILLVFQAMDAAGKDSTIRSVMQGVDPSGCQCIDSERHGAARYGPLRGLSRICTFGSKHIGVKVRSRSLEGCRGNQRGGRGTGGSG